MKIESYAALAAKKLLEPFQYEPEALRPLDVEIKISHCGICHSDVCLIDDDWKISHYPLVPGHEIIGTITEVGSDTHQFHVGERVGIGWQSGSCLECEWCLRGEENLCSQMQGTCVQGYGGYAKFIRVHSRFVFAIPEALTSENAAPLLCGGITVYSPLRVYEVNAAMKVGIIAIGGLGHLAIQYANAFGCEVTAFSTSKSKEAEAKSFGAHHFVSTKEEGALEKIAGSLDFILSTVSADLNWSDYINVLRPKGRLCIVGVPENDIQFPAFPVIMGQKSICGSPIGSPTMIREMLQFSALHGIKAQTEIFPMTDVNQAIARLRKNEARYRIVLEN